MKSLKYVSVLFICVFMFAVSGHETFASGSCSSSSGTTWSTAANWTGTCSGAGGIPGTGDDVTIAAGHPVTLDINTPTLSTLTINDTLNTGSNRSITTTGNLTINSGGTLTANASVITVGASGWFYSGVGTFNAGTSTVHIGFDGGTSVVNGNLTFYNLVFDPVTSGGDLHRIAGNIIVTNNMTVSPSGTGSVTVEPAASFDSVTVNGILSITATGSATSTYDTIGGALSVGSMSIGSAGTFTANGSTVTVTGISTPLIANGGTFNAGTSTINFTGNGSASLNSGTLAFYNVTSSGTGTKSFASSVSFLSGGTLSVTNGTFNSNTLISSATGATLSVTNATILLPTAFQVDYPFTTVTLGTGSTVDYDEAGAQTIESSHVYYNLTTSGTFNKTLNGPTTVTGTLTINSGIVDTSGSNYTLTVGSIVENGGSFNPNTSIVNFTGTSGTLYTWNGGGMLASAFTFNLTGNGSAVFNSTSMAICNLNSIGTGTKSVGGALSFRNGCTLSITNGTFNPNGNTVTALGTNIISVTNGTLIVDAATFAGDYVSFATVTLGSGSTVNYNRGGDQTVDSTKTYMNLTIDGSGTKSPDGTLTATGALTISGGGLDTGSGANYTLNIGSLVISGGSIIPNASTVNLTGTSGTLITKTTGGASVGTGTYNLTGNGDAVLLSSGSWTFYNLTSSGTGTKSLTGGAHFNMNTPGVFSVTNGTFDMGTGTANSLGGAAGISVTNATLNIGAATFGGNFSGFAAPTLGTGSTINYNGTGTQTVDNTLSYHNLSITGGSREVDFPTTGVLSVSNTFTASGTSGNILNLYSPVNGIQWTFAPAGTASVSYVAVRDGLCSSGAVSISKSNFTFAGNNGTCWLDITGSSSSSPSSSPRNSNGGRMIVPIINPSSKNGAALDFSIGTPSSGVVTLSFNADPSTVNSYAVSLDPMFAGVGIVPYAASSKPTFTLPNTLGVYKIYVEFFAPGGVHSSPVAHTVSVGKGSAVNNSSTAAGMFTRTLVLGSSGADVTTLQKFLTSQGFLKMPKGASYGYFGSATKTALGAFQVKYGIVAVGGSGYGMFGPKTQSKANSL